MNFIILITLLVVSVAGVAVPVMDKTTDIALVNNEMDGNLTETLMPRACGGYGCCTFNFQEANCQAPHQAQEIVMVTNPGCCTNLEIGMKTVWIPSCSNNYVDIYYFDQPGCKGNQVNLMNTDTSCRGFGPPMNYIASIYTDAVGSDAWPPGMC